MCQMNGSDSKNCKSSKEAKINEDWTGEEWLSYSLEWASKDVLDLG